MRKLKPGCTCKVLGEGTERFKVIEVDDVYAVIEGEHGRDVEPISKCYSVRYAPRLSSYYKDNLAKPTNRE